MRGNLDISGSPISIRDEGTSQGTVSAIDFVGAQVAATVSGAVATVTISSGSGDGTVDRVVETATTRTLATTQSLIAATYFEIQGTGSLVLEGDATLLVI